MNKLLAVLILSIFISNSNALDLEEFIATTSHLASDELKGRMAGTSYSKQAAHFIAIKFSAAGLKPLSDGTYLQAFQLANNAGQDANVVGFIPSESRTAESILILSHYDALGIDLSQSEQDRIRNGARDNAIGVAALVALAQEFATKPSPSVNLVFVATGAEEIGKQGALHYLESPLFDASHIVACLNIDGFNMTGKRSDYFVMPKHPGNFLERIKSVAHQSGWNYAPVGWEDSMDDKFDTAPFIEMGIPSATIWTGDKLPDGSPAPKVRFGDIHSVDDEINDNWDWSGVEQHLDLYASVLQSLLDDQKSQR